MPIKANFTKGSLKKIITADVLSIEKSLIAIMQRVGETFVAEAREDININSSAFPRQHQGRPQGAYNDQTTNLRNSIGYFILRNHEVVYKSFPGNNLGNPEEIVRVLPPFVGYRLVGFAAMEYASYLESQGYNVITSQGFLVMDRLKDQFKRLSKRRKEDRFDDLSINMNLSSQLK